MRADRGKSWKQAFAAGLVSGSLASALSALALAIRGAREPGTVAGPLNGPSQWIYGTWAAHRRDATLRHTMSGYAIHHVVSVGWATIHEKHITSLFPHTVAGRLGASLLTTAIAYVVDYKVAPYRLQPGFDKQLSGASIALVYGAFAAGLFLGTPRLWPGRRAVTRTSQIAAPPARTKLSTPTRERGYSTGVSRAAHPGGGLQ